MECLLPFIFCPYKIFIKMGLMAVDMKQKMYLLGPAEPHPHFEPSEKQLNHLVVLEIHSWTVQLGSCAPVVP